MKGMEEVREKNVYEHIDQVVQGTDCILKLCVNYLA